MSNPDDLRLEEKSLARRKAEHDKVQLSRAAELLDQISAACDELGEIGHQILTPYIEAHLTALKLDRDRAQMAVVSAEKSLASVLIDASA